MGRQTSELLFLTSTTMKAFIVLSLAATALAVPARGGRRQGGKNAQKKERIDPGNILRCTAENFGNNQTIKDCIDCFSTEMDFSSQTGLDAAKACATQYWPKGVAACGTEISAMVPGNMETLEAVVGCFDDRLKKGNAERCLGEATSTEVDAKMTEATMCILDSWKWAMGVVKAVNGAGKILLGNVVSDCIDEENVSTADADSLNEVVECGVKNVFEWLEEKNPKAAKMVGKFLKKMGADDDDDDDE